MSLRGHQEERLHHHIIVAHALFLRGPGIGEFAEEQCRG